MSDLVIEPESVITAVGLLFDASDALYAEAAGVAADCAGLPESVEIFEFPGIREVSEAVDTWADLRIPRHRAALEELAETIADHVQGLIEADEIASADFSALEDAGRWPHDPEARSTPLPDPPDPITDPMQHSDGASNLVES